MRSRTFDKQGRELQRENKKISTGSRCPFPTLRSHCTNSPQKACEKPDVLRWDTAPAPTVEFATVLRKCLVYTTQSVVSLPS